MLAGRTFRVEEAEPWQRLRAERERELGGVARTSRRGRQLESARGPANDLLITATYAWPQEQGGAIETEARTPLHAA
jgi:hypothetical protein